MNTVYAGPLARALDGVDLALPVGIAVASALYVVMMRRSRSAPGTEMRA